MPALTNISGVARLGNGTWPSMVPSSMFERQLVAHDWLKVALSDAPRRWAHKEGWDIRVRSRGVLAGRCGDGAECASVRFTRDNRNGEFRSEYDRRTTLDYPMAQRAQTASIHDTPG